MFRIWLRFWSGEKNEYEKYFKRFRKQKSSAGLNCYEKMIYLNWTMGGNRSIMIEAINCFIQVCAYTAWLQKSNAGVRALPRRC